jgi:hypothetical protein
LASPGTLIAVSADWTAIAAFTAAGLSAVNIGLSAQFFRRQDLYRWRRDVLLPVLVGVLEVADRQLMPPPSGPPRAFVSVRRKNRMT